MNSYPARLSRLVIIDWGSRTIWRLMSLVGLVGLLLSLPLMAQTTYWVASTNWTGTYGNGSTAAAPTNFSLASVRTWLGAAGPADLTLYFYSGDYQVWDPITPTTWEHKLRIAGDTNRTVRLIGIPNSTNAALPRLVMSAEPTNSGSMTKATTWPPDGSGGGWQETFIQTVYSTTPNGRAILADSIGYRDYLHSVVIENLELDGNFAGQRALTAAGNPSGYRSQAIDVCARTGRIRNVKVRNFGSAGQVPGSLVDGSSAAGIEAFPVRFITLDDLKPTNSLPWLVEEVEVSDFRWLHGGYGTMILGSVMTTDANSYGRPPVALIRRCVVNDGSIAFGAAGADLRVWNGATNLTNPTNFTMASYSSALARHEDNVVLNTGQVFNTDTGYVRTWIMTNGVYLDVRSWGNLGTAGSSLPSHMNYELMGNLLRLRGRFAAPAYGEFYRTTNNTWETNPDLPLGRIVDDWSNGLVIQGISSNIFFGQNQVTTWPAAGFYLADPASVTNSTFRVVWPIANNVGYDTQYYARTRYPSKNVSLWDNRLSTNAFVFTGGASLGDFTGSSQFTTFSESSAPNYTQSQQALTSLPAGFNPSGRVERVFRFWNAATNLAGVREIAFGQSYLTNGGAQLAVTLRAVEHRTAAGGTPGTTPLVANSLWLVAELVTPTGGTNTLGLVSGTTDATGQSVRTVNLGTNVHGLIRLKAWLPGTTTNFLPTSLAWASLDYPLGSVVSLVASPDVGDDKNTSAAKRAQLRFSRTGTPAALAASLTVLFQLPTNGVPELTSPVDVRNLLATYGSTGNGDYTFGTPTGGTLGTITPGGFNTVTFSANSNLVVIPIIPRSDNLTEANVIRATLFPTNSYARGASAQADVYIYDGPLWTVQTLEGISWSGNHESAALGVNAGVLGAGGWTVPPQAVGWATWIITSPPVEMHGGLWTPSSTPFTTDFGLFFRPFGISFRATTQATNRAWVVGNLGGSAYQILDDNSGGVTLPHFAGSSGSSAAWAISPNGARSAGYSTVSGLARPALWTGTNVPVDLSRLLADPLNERTGEAKAVNNAGVVVGYSTGFSVSKSQRRPFRNTGNGNDLTDSDWLAVPEDAGGTGAANTVATAGTNHYAVGWYKLSNSSAKVGVRWKPVSSQTLPSLAVDLWVLSRNGVEDLQSEAKGINSQLVVVGWSGASEMDVNRRAVFHDDGIWKDLNDKHFIHSSTGWTLQSAEAISDNRVIVGIGRLSGAQRGFMLIPRVPGN